MYLLDTNVISELRRVRPHGAVLAWIQSVPDDDLHISAASLGEIQAGIEITRERDAAKALEIEAWLGEVADTYNILPMDGRTFRAWARLMHKKPQQLLEDAMIAAAAVVNNLIVVTRDIRDFQALGVRTLNPFKRTGS
jgi:predicted nucleic acid-binding protein